MKARISLITLLLTGTLLFALAAEDYMIGAYSQYILSRAKDPGTALDSLGYLMDRSGFNTLFYSIHGNEIKQGKLGKALDSLNKYKLASVIDDWAWLDEGPIGVTPMAYGNYLKMEAEYTLQYEDDNFVPDQLPVDDSANDKQNYVFRHDTGDRKQSRDGKYSNDYAWVCDAKENHHAGYALAEPRFRWKPENRQHSRFIGGDFKFISSAKDNRIYVRVAMNFSGAEPDEKIATVSLKALSISLLEGKIDEYGRYPDGAYLDMPLKPSYPQLYDTTIYAKDYSGVPYDPVFGNYYFEFYAEVPQPLSKAFKDLIVGDYFYHLNPQVYWHGKGRLVLDYIEIEDEIYKALSNTSKTLHPYQERLQARLDEIDRLNGSESILFYYGKDEPFQGGFAPYDKLESYLNNRGKKLITATHLDNLGYVKPGNLPNYSHYGLFLQEAKPEVVMLDAYPLQEYGSGPGALMRWNNDFDHPQFVQNKIESILLENYYYLTSTIKRNPELAATKLFFVPQTYGEKYDPVDKSEWRFFMPPLSMQKCLQLMPLCYAAEGIVDFAITHNPEQSFSHGSRSYKRITPLSHAADYTNLKVRSGINAYQQLVEANQKIRVYGPIIKDLKWIDADSVMVKGKHPKLDLAKMKLKSLEVLSTGKGYYEGYVQCGYYTDSSSMPYFMLVNRRAVYKRDTKPELVPLEVDKYFIDAEPQTVRFTLDAKDGITYALYDPFEKKLYPNVSGNVDVLLPAGDGVLLKMIPVLNSEVNESRSLSSPVAIAGKVVVKKKTALNYAKDSSVFIADNSIITLEKGAELNLQGDTRFGKNVQIIVKPGAKLNYDPAKTQLGADTKITYKKKCWFLRLFGG